MYKDTEYLGSDFHLFSCNFVRINLFNVGKIHINVNKKHLALQ